MKAVIISRKRNNWFKSFIGFVTCLLFLFNTSCEKYEESTERVSQFSGLSVQEKGYLKSAASPSYFTEIINAVNELALDGSLSKGVGNSLIVKISNASKSFENGNTDATINQLKAFIHEVNDLVNNGLLTEEQGAYLANMAEEAALLTHGSFIDPRDGNFYNWVKIGDQIWMSQNLRATKYNDGTNMPIPPIDINNSGSSNDEWMSLTTSAYCWYWNNNNEGMRYTYGALYNVYAVNTGKLCPSGWHMPSDNEWTSLLNYLDPDGDDQINTAGGKMKSTGIRQEGTGFWFYPNVGATNESGFTGLPGGIRSNDAGGAFNHLFGRAYFWSSSENLINGGNYFRRLHYDSPILSTSLLNPKKTGMSVRCVKD
jgi:uncharacterized protein (TIGR02145 family)